MIFDRGFPSLSLIQKLLEHRLYFVMRVSSSFLKEVNAFRKSKYVDRVIHIEGNTAQLPNEQKYDIIDIWKDK